MRGEVEELIKTSSMSLREPRGGAGHFKSVPQTTAMRPIMAIATELTNSQQHGISILQWELKHNHGSHGRKHVWDDGVATDGNGHAARVCSIRVNAAATNTPAANAVLARERGRDSGRLRRGR
jgi:hypothetical protein